MLRSTNTSTRRVLGTLAALASMALLWGCATGPRVEAIRSPEAEFDQYRTFTFHRPLGTDRQEGAGTILSQSLRRATRAELEALGYEYVESGADLRVNFFVETREVVEGMRRNPSIGIGYGVFHRHYGVWSDYGTDVRQYTEGTLHVDVVDAGTNQLVWEGIARGRGDGDDLTFDPERVEQSVSRVFARFPRAVRTGTGQELGG